MTIVDRERLVKLQCQIAEATFEAFTTADEGEDDEDTTRIVCEALTQVFAYWLGMVPLDVRRDITNALMKCIPRLLENAETAATSRAEDIPSQH
jgi:hypothetical protein